MEGGIKRHSEKSAELSEPNASSASARVEAPARAAPKAAGALRRRSRARWSRPSVYNQISGRLFTNVLVAACCGLIFRKVIFVPYPIADGSHPYRADATLGPSIVSEIASLPANKIVEFIFSSPQVVAQLIPTSIVIALTKLLGSPAGWNTAIVLMSKANYDAAHYLAHVVGLRSAQCRLIGLSFATGPTLMAFIGGPTLSLFLAPSIYLIAVSLSQNRLSRIKVILLSALSLMCSDASATIAILVILFLSLERILKNGERSLPRVFVFSLALALLSVLGKTLRATIPVAVYGRQWSDWLFYGLDLRSLWRPLSGSPTEVIAGVLGFDLSEKGLLATPWQHFSPGVVMLLVLIVLRARESRWSPLNRSNEIEESRVAQVRRIENLAFFMFFCTITPLGKSTSILHIFAPSFWLWTGFPILRYTGRILPVVLLLTLVVLLGRASIGDKQWPQRILFTSISLLAAANVVTTHLRVGAITYDELTSIDEPKIGKRDVYVISFNMRAETLKWLPFGFKFAGIVEDLEPELEFAGFDFHRSMLRFFDEGCESLPKAFSFAHWDYLLVEGLAEERERCRGETFQLSQGREIIDLELYERGASQATEELAGFVAELSFKEGLQPFAPFLTRRETAETSQTFVVNRLDDKPEGGGEQTRFAEIRVEGPVLMSTTIDYFCINAKTNALVVAGRMSLGEYMWILPEGCQILRFIGIVDGLEVSISPFLRFTQAEPMTDYAPAL